MAEGIGRAMGMLKCKGAEQKQSVVTSGAGSALLLPAAREILQS